jgi:hypothetical protein
MELLPWGLYTDTKNPNCISKNPCGHENVFHPNYIKAGLAACMRTQCGNSLEIAKN